MSAPRETATVYLIGEKLDLAVDFTAGMAEGQTINSQSVTIRDRTGATSTHLTNTTPGASGKSVIFRLTVESTAVRGADYLVDVYATLSGGEIVGSRTRVAVI